MTTAMTYDSLVLELQAYLDRNNSSLVAQIPNFITMAEIRCSREVKNLGTKTAVVSTFLPGQAVYQKPARWLETISINFGKATQYSTESRVAAAGVRTLTLSEEHSFNVGDSFSVFNVGGTGYNGDFVVSAVTQFTVSYSSGSTTEAEVADTDGIVSYPLNKKTQLMPRSYEYCANYWPDRELTGVPKFYADYNYDNLLIAPTPDIGRPFELVYFERPEPLSSSNQTNWFTQYARDLLLYACLVEAIPYLKNDQRIETWKSYYSQSLSQIKMENKERVNDANIKRVE